MRRRPGQHNNRQTQNNGGGHRRHGSSGGGHSNNNNRPRKNYPQLREKYINQARDALSVGDRVMAEYYFQHADHCYRMMVESGYRPQSESQDTSGGGDAQPQEIVVEDTPVNPGALPSFLTMGYTAAAATSNEQQAAAEPAQGQWEEN